MQFENKNDQLKKYLQTINSCHNDHLFPVLDIAPILLRL